MIRLIDFLLVERTLGGLLVESLINIAIVDTQSRAEDLIANVETIDDAHGVDSYNGQQLFEAFLQVRHVFVVQARELKGRRNRRTAKM